MMGITDQERAEKSAKVMWVNDAASQGLGISLDRMAPGEAVASMSVKEKHLNGHNICYGGYIFSLADTAFAFACNSYNQRAVAQHNSITYLNPAKLGDVLIAHAKMVTQQGRSGIYDVDVQTKSGQMIALFRGNSRTVSGVHFSEDTQ